MAVFKVLSDTNSNILSEADSGRYSDFVSFLSALAKRFHAAEVLADIFGDTTSEIVERSMMLGITQKDAQYRTTHNLQDPEVAYRSNDVAEAELLDCVAKMIDLGLSTNAKIGGKCSSSVYK